MRVIRVPRALRAVSALILLSVPLVAAETILVLNAPWWRLPYTTIVYWAVTFSLLFLPVIYWITRGRQWALPLVGTLGVAWCLASASIAIATRNTSLGFFTIFLMAYWVGLLAWLRLEMRRSFFDSGVAWYQSVPKAIPGLRCQVKFGPSAASESPPSTPSFTDVRVSRMDEDGTFVFSDTALGLNTVPIGEADLVFRYRGREVSCHATAISLLPDRRGVGFQFSRMSPDSRKELGDFVWALRGEGYV